MRKTGLARKAMYRTVNLNCNSLIPPVLVVRLVIIHVLVVIPVILLVLIVITVTAVLN